MVTNLVSMKTVSLQHLSDQSILNYMMQYTLDTADNLRTDENSLAQSLYCFNPILKNLHFCLASKWTHTQEKQKQKNNAIGVDYNSLWYSRNQYIEIKSEKLESHILNSHYKIWCSQKRMSLPPSLFLLGLWHCLILQKLTTSKPGFFFHPPSPSASLFLQRDTLPLSEQPVPSRGNRSGLSLTAFFFSFLPGPAPYCCSKSLGFSAAAGTGMSRVYLFS